MKLADDQRKTRADLVAQRTASAKVLAGLPVEKAGIEGQRKVAEADLGPVRYLATQLGADSETALPWFVLIVVARPGRGPTVCSRRHRRGGSLTCAVTVNGCSERNARTKARDADVGRDR
jgi:hypothetical protein